MTGKRYDEDFKKQLVKIYNQGNHSYRSLGDEYRKKYSISAMCKLLKVQRSLVYYHLNKEPSTPYNEESIITKHIERY
ncbi:hypothetical protein L0P56_05725, partial [Anaerosalibacter bizertensis]|nr:hypothetical protein [Anaerosalibacter bizertensis]